MRGVTSSPQPPMQEFRDVFVFDPSFDLKGFLRNPANNQRAIVHPDSQHIISKYSLYLYDHKQYNYNDLGEFSLGLLAAEYIKTSTSNMDATTAGQAGTHNVLFWPEGVMLSGLLPADIPLVADYMLNKLSTVSDIPALHSKVNAQCIVSQLTTTLVTKITKTHTFANALQATMLMSTAFYEHNEPVNYALAVDLLGGTRKGNVLLLPGNDVFEAVWHSRQAQGIVQDYRADALERRSRK